MGFTSIASLVSPNPIICHLPGKLEACRNAFCWGLAMVFEGPHLCIFLP